MTVERIVYGRDGNNVHTWGRWVDGRLEFFSFCEGGTKANFAVRLKWGWLPVWLYVAIPIAGRWLRFCRGRSMFV